MMRPLTTIDVGCGVNAQGDVNLDAVRTKDCNLVGDACFLPFRDNCFNNLIAQAVLEHLNNPTQAMKEFVRILEPKGTAKLIVPKPFFTNNSFSHFVRFILNLPISLFPFFLRYEFMALRRLKREPRMRHKAVIRKEYIEIMSNKIGFRILEFTEMENVIYCWFPRRVLRKHPTLQKLFSFIPKIYWCSKIICQKT